MQMIVTCDYFVICKRLILFFKILSVCTNTHRDARCVRIIRTGDIESGLTSAEDKVKKKINQNQIQKS